MWAIWARKDLNPATRWASEMISPFSTLAAYFRNLRGAGSTTSASSLKIPASFLEYVKYEIYGSASSGNEISLLPMGIVSWIESFSYQYMPCFGGLLCVNAMLNESGNHCRIVRCIIENLIIEGRTAEWLCIQEWINLLYLSHVNYDPRYKAFWWSCIVLQMSTFCFCHLRQNLSTTLLSESIGVWAGMPHLIVIIII